MSKSNELADALLADWSGGMDDRDQIEWFRAELRTLARAAAKAAWEEGYADGFEDGAADPEMSPITTNPYSTESYE